jgi:deoxyribonuclease V
MIIPRAPHSWRLSPAAAIRVQRELAGRIATASAPGPFRWIAGLDAAFSPDGRECIAGVVLWDRPTGSVIEQHTARRPLRFPYVPGLLSFREVPALLAALRKLRQRPDVLMCDGQGRAHPRRFGLACHLGLLCGLPSIGCAKSRLIGTHHEPGLRRGSRASLTDRGELIGEVLRTQPGVRPLYVSVGHGLSLEQCRGLVLECATRFRLPEPTRLADRLVARAKRGFESRITLAPTTPQKAAGDHARRL